MPGGCFPRSGTYPIAIRDTLLNATGFVYPDGYYSDETYQNKTWKIITLHDASSNPSGGFDWLRWRAESTNSITFTASLSGTGTLGAGFDEAPWPPSSFFTPPAGYPLLPHQLNGGDWVYGYTGVVNTTSIRAALDEHIVNKTLMILPIQDGAAGIGTTSSLHIAHAGAFLLLEYNLSGTPMLALVYISEPALAACSG
jgi:hypothetical protein